MRPIGNERFDVSFRNVLGEDDFDRVWAAVDPQRTIVFWGIQGAPGQVWAYNWVLDRASVIELPFDGIFAGFESSLTLEEVSLLFPNLDAMPFSLDDARFKGGAPRLYIVQNGVLGVLNGSNLPATLEVAQFAPYGENVARLRAVWPDTDATQGVSVTIEASQRRGDGPLTRSAGNMQSSGRIPIRSRGKHMTLRLDINNPNWTYANAVTIEVEAGGVR